MPAAPRPSPPRAIDPGAVMARPDQVGRKRERFRLEQVFGLVGTPRRVVSTYRCGAAPASGPGFPAIYLSIRMERYLNQRAQDRGAEGANQ